MPVRAGSVSRQTSDLAERKPLSLPSVKANWRTAPCATGCKASDNPKLLHHVGFARKVQIGLDGRGAKHHVEAASADFRHIFRHDRVALLRHDRYFVAPPFGAHAERQKAYPQRRGDGGLRPKNGRRVRPRSHGSSRAARRRARIGRRVRAKSRRRPSPEKSDNIGAIADRRPAEIGPHAVEEGADAAASLAGFAAIGDGGMPGPIERNFLVLGADGKALGRFRSGLEPGDKLIARRDRRGIRNVARHLLQSPSR